MFFFIKILTNLYGIHDKAKFNRKCHHDLFVEQ